MPVRSIYQINRRELRQRLIDTFPSGLMTMLSVVLGVAIYFDVMALRALLVADACLLETLLGLSKVAFVFLLIVGMFHTYQYTTPLLSEPPGYLSSLPVFWIGTSLVALAASIEPEHFRLFASACLAFFGGSVFAFSQSLARAHKMAYDPVIPNFQDIKTNFVKNSSRNMGCYYGLAIVSAGYIYFTLTRPTTVAPNPCANCPDIVTVDPRWQDFAFLAFSVAVLWYCIRKTRVQVLAPLYESFEQPPRSM